MHFNKFINIQGNPSFRSKEKNLLSKKKPTRVSGSSSSSNGGSRNTILSPVPKLRQVDYFT